MSEKTVSKKRGRKPGSKGHCSYCGAVGHYKKTCPKFLAENINLSDEEKAALIRVDVKVGVDPDDK